MAILKNSSIVKPAKIEQNAGICMSDCDQDKSIAHALTIYFYRPSKPISLESATQIMKTSLSEALVHFYPLAGRLHLIEGGRVRLECNSAGALFVEAESNATLDDFKDFAPTTEIRYSLIPTVDYNVPQYEIPLLIAQLTRFSCGGISLGVGMSHVMIDGASAAHFISEWARIARGEPLENPPFLDRSLLLATNLPAHIRFKHDRFDPPPLLLGRSDAREELSKATSVTMMRVTRMQVEKLKEIANENRPNSIRPYSRYETLAGHIWRCASKAREHIYEQPTKVFIPVSFRNRMSIPKSYFGNAYVRKIASGLAGDMVSRPLAYAAGKIREAVEIVTDEYVKSAINHVKEQPDLAKFKTVHSVGSKQGAFYGNPNLDITSWLGIPIHGTNFGWGKEVYMGPGSLNVDGKCYIFPSGDKDGSLFIALRLQVAHTDNFIKLFYEHILV